MSHSGRPAPIHPPFQGSDTRNIPNTPRQLAFPAPSHAIRPEQRGPGPQLPSIHSMPFRRPAYDESGHPVQLPPIRLTQTGAGSHSGETSRAIPVAHLLSNNPPSPSRSQQPFPTQSALYRSPPPAGYAQIPRDPRFHMQSRPQMLSHRPDNAPMAYRQQQPVHPQETLPRQPYHTPHSSVSIDNVRPQNYSPAASSYASPASYSNSEASPRSSLAPSQRPPGSQKRQTIQPPPLMYTLSIRQQPVAARACGFGERDRRVIDPPPILELKTTDRNGLPEQDLTGHLALNVTLLNPDGNDDETELLSANPDVPATKRLMGTTVASPYPAKDDNGVAGTFFVFPDLSCRSPGKYRVKFKLLRVDPLNCLPGTPFAGNVASIVSDVFDVYTAKDFPGMRASSSLLKALRRQGFNVGVKKGSEARKGKGKLKKQVVSGSSSEGEEDSDVAALSPKSKRSKNGKRRKRGNESKEASREPMRSERR